jgi:hypothetical protein
MDQSLNVCHGLCLDSIAWDGFKLYYKSSMGVLLSIQLNLLCRADMNWSVSGIPRVAGIRL